jgi:hypothetical protein
MVLVRLGAPLWLGALIVTWGAVAAVFAFTSSTAMFLLLRLALGVAECGAFPGKGLLESGQKGLGHLASSLHACCGGWR